MSFAIITDDLPDGRAIATLAVALRRLHIQPFGDKNDQENYARESLGRQMDFIHGLFEPSWDIAAELRYLFDPQAPYTVRVYCLVRVTGDTADAARCAAGKRGEFFISVLQVNTPYYEFEPVADPDQLSYLVQPFEPAHIAELIRREDRIALDSPRRSSARPAGFQPSPDQRPDTTERIPPEIYHVFPYSLSLDNMKRLCSILLLQSAPCLVSICLRPYLLTDADEERMEERICLCEKYAQLSLKSTENVEQLRPFLKKQAELLYQSCARELTQLQDAAFLFKVQIVSAQPVPHELITVTGATLTEHTGHPHLPFAAKDIDALSGGYNWYQPADAPTREIARKNFTAMAFTPWIPTVADPGCEHWRYLFHVSQVVAGFRLPLPVHAEFPGIDTAQYQPKSAPSDLPNQGLVLGEHLRLHQRRPVCLKTEDRLRHAYMVGQTGTGKSTLFFNMILQDIREGRGVGLIDPHGELIEALLPLIPRYRDPKDVICVFPQDYDHPVGINLLEYGTPFQKDFCVNYLIEVFDELYGLRETGGPMFEMYMRNTLQLMLDHKLEDFSATVLDVPRVFQDRGFRKHLLENSTNPYVANFWVKEAEKAGGEATLQNVAPYITSKLSRFVYNEIIRCIMGQRHSTINFRELMDQGRILLVDLRKGMLGETNSHFLGMILVGKILAAALSRADTVDRTGRRPFFLYVDEFQNLATRSFVTILSEARKYGLALTLTNQYISQLKEYIIKGILGNVGTLISFRVGFDDADLLSKEFGRVVSPNDLMGLPNWNAYLRMLSQGDVSSPFNFRTLPPAETGDPKMGEPIREIAQKTYGRPRRKVEQEILQTWRTFK